MRGRAKRFPTDFARDWQLAQQINLAFGAVVCTPWTIGQMPVDDLAEVLYVLDLREQLEEIAKGREGQGDGTKH